MLNRSKLLKELELVASTLFIDRSHEYEIIRNVWREIVADPTFLHKVREVNAPWPVPFWQGDLGLTVPVSQEVEPYHALSVDGSQIYPDRHQSVPCFLINIGMVGVRYDGVQPPVHFDSNPYIFSNAEPDMKLELSAEIVNCKRQEIELRDGMQFALRMRDQVSPSILFFDGSLIFWHLEAKDPMLRDLFLPRYLAILCQLAKEKIITVGYISSPKSRELVNLVRLQLCKFDTSNEELFHLVDGMVDATIAGFYLKPFERSTVFQNNSSVSDSYPDHVRPHFFYLHVGEEIGRVEIPAWIAQDQKLVDFVAQAILDQSIKGRGYPVVLAEAHEQAVVKGPDRDFFYHLLQKIGIDRNYRTTSSHKAMRKRSMGI